jgi:hypothetical protein
MTPLGFEETAPGIFCLWLNNPSANIDMQHLAADTQNAIAELFAMSSVAVSSSPDSVMG